MFNPSFLFANEATQKVETMIRKNANKMNMYALVRSILDENQPIWNGTPVFLQTYQRFVDFYEELLISENQHSLSSKEKTEFKDLVMQNVLNKGDNYRSILVFFAKATSNNALLSRVKMTITFFKSGTTREKMVRLSDVVEALEMQAVELADYGISSTEITDFVSQFNLLKELVKNPRKHIANRTTITARISELVKLIDELLDDELNPLVRLFKDSHPKFVSNYFAARVVVDRHGKPKPRLDIEAPERDDGRL